MKKRFLSFLMVLVILTTIMVPLAFADNSFKLVISIPEPTVTPEPTTPPKPTLLDEVFEELSEELGLSEECAASCKQYLENYFAGVWDGLVAFPSDGSVHELDPATRYYTFFDCSELEEPLKLNIDYSGPFEVKGGDNCSFAYDVSSGTIEQWQFFENQNSWVIPSFGGEDISYGIISLSSTRSDAVARVTVYDDGKILAIYDLKDQGKTEKLY